MEDRQLEPTALLFEAWLKLRASRTVSPESNLHLERIAGRAMVPVLVAVSART
jgi:hypothetical protein